MDAGNAFLQLVEPLDETSSIAAWLSEHGEGLHHVCFGVDDVEQAVTSLSDPGAPVVLGNGRGRVSSFVTRPAATECGSSAPSSGATRTSRPSRGGWASPAQASRAGFGPRRDDHHLRYRRRRGPARREEDDRAERRAPGGEDGVADSDAARGGKGARAARKPPAAARVVGASSPQATVPGRGRARRGSGAPRSRPASLPPATRLRQRLCPPRETGRRPGEKRHGRDHCCPPPVLCASRPDGPRRP